ncbi:probable poly(beta-D-mannuronate) O-acetylase [alpha proteobacterium U9-1i]|nr:probable poly(beta-D-mannuronate) O-acetylase [alpha proteobacterium U9-1i]
MDNILRELVNLSVLVQGLAFAELLQAVIALSAYIVLGNAILRPSYSLRLKAALFAVLNITAVYAFFFQENFAWPIVYERTRFLSFAAYLAFGALHWFLVDAVGRWRSTPWVYWLALLFPIAPLVVVKFETAWHLIGFSYMAFRMAQAAFEKRRKPDLELSLSNYLAFLFFPLTIPIGPISPFAYFSRGVGNGVAPSLLSMARGLARIALGYVMLRFLATLSFQLSFGGMWSDGFKHGVGDVLIASYATLAHLYFNFAGFTHIVIGASALVGIPVKENFDSPVLSRSIKEFWNRWHITLSEFVRDLVYTPLAVSLTRALGAPFALPAAIFAAMVTFTIIGVWHQFSLGFLLFGVMHGIGFSVNVVFDQFWRRGGRATGVWAAPRAGLSWLLTMTYIALSMVFIEFPTMEQAQAALTAFEPRW